MESESLVCEQCSRVNLPQANFCATCGRPLRASPGKVTGVLPAVHPLLRGRYRVLERIGQGGFGAVYKAEDTALGNRLVAVKEMGQHGLNERDLLEAQEAFQREALLLANLNHPSLPHIYEQFGEDGRSYLVMEYIDGTTLEEGLNLMPARRLEVQETLEIALQICDVLDYLHTRQPPIIFRDLKPANVMLTPQGDLYLIDFGIARFFTPGKAKDTIRFGSPGYAPPEQYGQAQTTAQSDIYSLGALLHQLLSGIDPTNTPFVFAPLRLAQPAGLERLITQMLSLKMEDRPASIAVVRLELQRLFASGREKTRDEWLEEGKWYAQGRQFERALAAYERAARLDPRSAGAQNNKAAALIELKRYDEALAACDLALLLDPDLLSAHHNRAAALLGLNRYQEALRECAQALRLDSNNPLAYSNQAAALLGLKQYEAALLACERAIELAPDSASAYSKKGRALLALKRYTEAAAACEWAVHLDPQHVRAYLNLGAALLELRNYQEALAAYEQAIQLGPLRAGAHAGKGRALKYLLRYEEAVEAFDQSIRLAPAQANFYHQKGKALLGLKRPEEALEAYERAIQLDPALALTHADAGDALSTLNRHQEALEAYERAIQLDPHFVYAYRGKGLALERLGRPQEAQRAYDQARTLRRAAG
ncbi:MAG TPA: tetratricopeptide repeat protein [Ktedonobacterales bacterium]